MDEVDEVDEVDCRNRGMILSVSVRAGPCGSVPPTPGTRAQRALGHARAARLGVRQLAAAFQTGHREN